MHAAPAIRLPPRASALGLVLLLVLTGCAHWSGAGRAGSGPSNGERSTPVDLLRNDLTALAPTVREDEARYVASTAVEGARELRRNYGMVWPPLFHNFLVNLGIKERGLCYHWAEDLLARLQERKLTSLEFHWGIARARTVREHNCVIVTAARQPLESGIVLDAWRRSGRLYWTSVSADRYPWEKGPWTPAGNEPPSGRLQTP